MKIKIYDLPMNTTNTPYSLNEVQWLSRRQYDLIHVHELMKQSCPTLMSQTLRKLKLW